MATTTNYGWTTPDDTALVKDGASAIRTLGSSIDTSVKSLNPGTTSGDIDYYTSSTAKARLAKGTAGQVLAMNSGATAPEWTTLSTGGMTLISETVASANSSLSLSSIPGTYKQIVLFWSGIYHSNTSTYFDLRINNNSGAVYGELFHFGFNSSSNQTSDNTFSTVGVSAFGENLATSFAIDGGARGYLLIDNYASTTKLKQYRATMILKDNAGNKVFRDITGIFNSTSAVTSLDVVRTTGTGTFTNGTNTSIRLYGVS